MQNQNGINSSLIISEALRLIKEMGLSFELVMPENGSDLFFMILNKYAKCANILSISRYHKGNTDMEEKERPLKKVLYTGTEVQDRIRI